MEGPLSSFLLRRGSIGRAFKHERDRADQAQVEVERLQRMLDLRDLQILELRENHEQLRQRLDAMEQANKEWRIAATTHQTNAERWRREYRDEQRRLRQQQHERRADEAELDAASTSDLFWCRDCDSLWLLTLSPNRTCRARRPVGDGCHNCNDQSLARLWTVKTSSAAPALAIDIARPVHDLPSLEVTVEVPGDGAVRSDIATTFMAEWIKEGLTAAVSKTVSGEAIKASRRMLDDKVPADGCVGLHAIATGLDRVSKIAKDGIAWCATEIIGIPDFPAKVLSELLTPALLQSLPLGPVVQGIRIVGSISCATDNCIGTCPCFRDLVSKDMAEPLIAHHTNRLLDKAIHDVMEPATIDDPPLPDLPRLDGPSNLGF